MSDLDLSALRARRVVLEARVPGETDSEARQRLRRNRMSRMEAEAWNYAVCVCGMARINVVHEMNPETSPEGPDYYRGWEQHPFRALGGAGDD